MDANNVTTVLAEKVEPLPISGLNEEELSLKSNEILQPIVDDHNSTPDDTIKHDTLPESQSNLCSQQSEVESVKELLKTDDAMKNDSKEIQTLANDNNSPILKESKQTEVKDENCKKDDNEIEIIDAQELTEQILNMLNEGKTESVLSPQELLKNNVELQEFIVKLIKILREKINLCANLERQNTALFGQVQSLKDVISITKDLLGIRNMEVEHLHEDMTSMEGRIKEERVRHNVAVARLNEAMSLNDRLKKEYLVQMDLFQKLRDKYNEKIVNLTKENQRFLHIMKSNGMENLIATEAIQEKSDTKNGPESVAQLTTVEANEENVDK